MKEEELKSQNKNLLNRIDKDRQIFEVIYDKTIGGEKHMRNDDLRSLIVDIRCYAKQAIKELK